MKKKRKQEVNRLPERDERRESKDEDAGRTTCCIKSIKSIKTCESVVDVQVDSVNLKQFSSKVTFSAKSEKMLKSNNFLTILIVTLITINSVIKLVNCQEYEPMLIPPNQMPSQAIGRNITAILDNFFDHGYDKRVRPKYGKTPVKVKVSMYIVGISSVSEVSMDFTSDFYFRQSWIDSRLSFETTAGIESLSVGSEVGDKIWVPDTFFANEKSAYFHIATTPNTFIRIFPNGGVLLSMRLTVTASCPMELQYFPMDRQMCTIEIESYGYSTTDIHYEWKDDEAVKLDDGVKLPQFRVVGHEQKEKTIPLSTGNYSRLLCEIKLVRSMGYYLIQIYIPASLIVVISWVSFWLHRNATPARVQLGVLTVLTMTTLMSSTNSQLPKISYIKSIDVFLGTCFVMVFAALLEYAAVGYIGKRISMRKNKYTASVKAAEERRRTKFNQLIMSNHHENQRMLMYQHQQQQHQPSLLSSSQHYQLSSSAFPANNSNNNSDCNNGGQQQQFIQLSPPLPMKTTSSNLPGSQHFMYQSRAPPSESESEGGVPPPLPPPPPSDYEPSIPTFSQHYLTRYKVSRQPSLLYHRSAEDVSTPPLTSPPSPFNRSISKSHKEGHSSGHHKHHLHRRHSSKKLLNINYQQRSTSGNGNSNNNNNGNHDTSNIIHYATIRRPHVVSDRCPDGTCNSGHGQPTAALTMSSTAGGQAVTMTTQSNYYNQRFGTPGTQLIHRPHEVRLEMVGSKATASTIGPPPLLPQVATVQVNDSPPFDEMIDLMSPASTVGGGGPDHLRHRGSVSAQAMSTGKSGGGLGGEKEDYTKSASMTATPGNIVIPKNLNELFGVSPSDIDKYSRVVFPVCFVCFNLMYWMIYLHISKILEED